MPGAFDLAKTFVALRADGGAEPFAPTRSFWAGRAATASGDRVLGAFEFASPADLHSKQEEVHPHADELLVVVSGALDVVLREAGGERTIALAAGEAAIVPRGVWHRLVMRAPGRLLFLNSRAGMETRTARAGGGI